ALCAVQWLAAAARNRCRGRSEASHDVHLVLSVVDGGRAAAGNVADHAVSGPGTIQRTANGQTSGQRFCALAAAVVAATGAGSWAPRAAGNHLAAAVRCLAILERDYFARAQPLAVGTPRANFDDQAEQRAAQRNQRRAAAASAGVYDARRTDGRGDVARAGIFARDFCRYLGFVAVAVHS